MNENRLRRIFYFSSAVLFAIMLLTGREAGISCDEVLHYNQSVAVYNYFTSHGADQSALNTPVTHLKFYGQSYDNLVTFLIKYFNIDDVYGFRHLMSTIAGWLVILLTALFAIWIGGYGPGITVLLLFAVSPTFIGHSLNNLKDIPFTLGYISSVFFCLKFLYSGHKASIKDIVMLLLGIAFALSIRAGGLILICYMYLFFFIYYLNEYLNERSLFIKEILIRLSWMIVITVVSIMLSIILWPYALQSPFRNILESYHVMAHFPGTFRQIFEGKYEWSDFMPWYYIPVSMVITIPVIVLTGFSLFILQIRTVFRTSRSLIYGLILITILFPVVFVIYEKSNLYSSWRQFLFLYPGIVLLASTGIFRFVSSLKRVYFKWGAIAVFAILSIHPVRFMIKNHPYYYLYYNQIVGGLKGAYGNYEADYYYVSQTEASKWLIDYIGKNNIRGPLKVKATYSVEWQFRNHPEIETSYFRYEERSQADWDYAIVVNRYISPFMLKNDFWPPANSIHVIYVDSVPICAVIERKSKDDFYGYKALSEGNNSEAVRYFEDALRNNGSDELIFFNFAAALYNEKEYLKADSVLKKGLEINPECEPILMYLGNIARAQNRSDDAIRYYEKVISVNRKYFEAYVALSQLLYEGELQRARSLLRTCLTINPGYKPAIVALADTYRKTDPGIARKYDELANSIK